jgi:hypothetical protein
MLTQKKADTPLTTISWRCPHCGGGSFAHRVFCDDCGSRRPEPAAGQATLSNTPGTEASPLR